MNIKKRIIRLLIVVSVLWGLFLFSMKVTHPEVNSIELLSIGIGVIILWWAVICIGFWVTAGFRGKPKDE